MGPGEKGLSQPDGSYPSQTVPIPARIVGLSYESRETVPIPDRRVLSHPDVSYPSQRVLVSKTLYLWFAFRKPQAPYVRCIHKNPMSSWCFYSRRSQSRGQIDTEYIR